MILDASFLIDLERGIDAAQAALDAMVAARLPMRGPAQAASEFLSGYEDQVANLHDLERSLELIEHDRAHLIETARLARATLAAGTFPGCTDVQVAAAAVLAR